MNNTTEPPTDIDDDWQARGACLGLANIMFAPANNDVAMAKAKAVCAECPVIAECREHAITHPEKDGVWGGLTETERRPMIAAAGSQQAFNAPTRPASTAPRITPQADFDLWENTSPSSGLERKMVERRVKRDRLLGRGAA